MKSLPQSHEQLVPMRIASEMLSRSPKWIYGRIKADPSFPKLRRVSAHSVAFKRSELMAWIDNLPNAETDGLTAIERRQLAQQRAA